MTNIKYLLFISIFLTGCVSVHPLKTEQVSFEPQKAVSSIEVPTLEITDNIPQQKQWNSMVGNWYGIQTEGQDSVKQQLMERFTDGSYKLTTVHKRKEREVSNHIEVGYWGVSGPVYFSIFKGWVKHDKLAPSDTSNPNNYKAYKILELTDKQFKYQSVSTGTTYSLKKVPKDFVFPVDTPEQLNANTLDE